MYTNFWQSVTFSNRKVNYFLTGTGSRLRLYKSVLLFSELLPSPVLVLRRRLPDFSSVGGLNSSGSAITHFSFDILS